MGLKFTQNAMTGLSGLLGFVPLMAEGPAKEACKGANIVAVTVRSIASDGIAAFNCATVPSS
ncbi:hypothetical protein GXW82_10610 [Streptacidiphilus sp. 4-A2]|nr:hypothetical protein [Streptacidiphilus sp. 4-A2]